MTSFGAMQDEVLSHQLNDAKYRPWVRRWINEGEKVICQQADIRTQQTQVGLTTGVDPFVVLPEDFLRTIDVRLGVSGGSDDLLERMELRDYDERTPASGQPHAYIVIGEENLYLYPTPTIAYDIRLRYYRRPNEMDADGDQPEIPRGYHHLLVRYALIRCYERENDYDAATYMRDAFDKELMKLRTNLQYDTHDGPTQVPGSFEDGDSVPPANVWF